MFATQGIGNFKDASNLIVTAADIGVGKIGRAIGGVEFVDEVVGVVLKARDDTDNVGDGFQMPVGGISESGGATERVGDSGYLQRIATQFIRERHDTTDSVGDG